MITVCYSLNSSSPSSKSFFVFEKSDIYPFWMKDMKFAIDIIWIMEDGN